MSVRFALALFILAYAASAQASPLGAQAASAAPTSTAVANPTYVSIPMEITVNRPAAEVWKRIGKYCDLIVGRRGLTR